MSKDTGGPAFPFEEKHADGTHYHTHEGMTLRDYFAAKALPVAMAMLERDFNADLGADWAWNQVERELCAECAYEMADAMLAERSKQ